VSIRAFVLRAHSLGDSVALTARAARFLEDAVVSGHDVLVAGGTQAGNTLNDCASWIRGEAAKGRTAGNRVPATRSARTKALRRPGRCLTSHAVPLSSWRPAARSVLAGRLFQRLALLSRRCGW
jgi:hypothetical protein